MRSGRQLLAKVATTGYVICSPNRPEPEDEGLLVLVLSRKVGERILIGDKIAVTVVKLGHGGVRIGIEAPAELPIVREELADAMDEAEQRLSVDAADCGQPR